MFERRLKIFLLLLIAMTFLILVRSAYVQIVDAGYWRQQGLDAMKHTTILEPIRGNILDCKGRVLASDEPCMDAVVAYQAIARDEQWMRAHAIERLKARNDEYSKARKADRERMVGEELGRLNADLDAMWRFLAEVSGKSLDEIAQIKANIRGRVEMRRRWLQYQSLRRDERKRAEEKDDLPDWLLADDGETDIDKYSLVVPEQQQAHVILAAIKPQVYTLIKKRAAQFPGLDVRQGKHRYYAYGDSACHILGHMATVTREDLANQPDPDDELRRYFLNDEVGRSGIEALCEQALRGTRGRVRTLGGWDEVIESSEPVKGRDVSLSIDIELQRKIEDAFRHTKLYDRDESGHLIVTEEHEMHGAAVVIDVASGEVRAMVSYPTFDLNEFDELYPKLVLDSLNQPLLNRATQMAIEPGSTAKPMVGLGAVTSGLITPEDTIECTGFLVIDGRRYEKGRCWTASKYLFTYGAEAVKHHKMGSDPHPTGFLTLADAIQRSCNVYFETLGHRFGLGGLRDWFYRFGLGRQTGICLPEVAGHIPDPNDFLGSRRDDAESAAWFSAIGQSQVQATPIQMANVAATIARDGLWMRPRLVASEDMNPTTRPAMREREDLGLSPAGLAAVKEGMWRVVNTRAGSGHNEMICKPYMPLAGKTGTAQAGRLSIPVLGPDGKPQLDENGRVVRELPPIYSPLHPDPRAPKWYRGQGKDGTDLSHAWFIGFAPADRPTIAFAVAMEYGGSGGIDTGHVVETIINSCIDEKYLPDYREGREKK